MNEHGTDSCYVNRKCRCVPCRQAHAEAAIEHNRARSAAKQALIHRHRAEYNLLYEAICAARGLSNKVGPPFRSGS